MGYSEEECTHGIIFNYANGKSRCGECEMEFITTKQGQRLSVKALENVYKALRDLAIVVECGEHHKGKELNNAFEALTEAGQ